MTTVNLAETAESVELHGFWTRSRKLGLTYLLLGFAVAAGQGLWGMNSQAVAAFRLDKTVDVQWDAPAQLLVIVLAVVGAACGGLLISGREQARFTLLAVVGAATLAAAELTWSVAEVKAAMQVETILALSVVAALPLIYGSLAGVLCERSGVINVGIEGQLLAGAFSGALFGTLSGNVWIGILAASLSGAIVTILLAALAIRYVVDQVVLGVILNLLVLGVTGLLYDKLMTTSADTYNHPPSATKWELPVLGDIPILGPAIFRQNVFVYIAIALVGAVWVMLFHTRWGLRTRSVGEHPAAADTVGIKVNALRFRNVMIAGLVSGLGGAVFTLDSGLGFGKDMTVGKGFIALAVLIVGRWNPLGALAGAMLFGFADSVQRYLSGTETGFVVPSEFLKMLPYIVTIVVVAGLVGKVKAPAADGKPYVKS